MHMVGMDRVLVDEHAYVYGELPATPGCEKKETLVFIAHLDTIPDFPGKNVRPQVFENYDGDDILLGDSGRVLSMKDFPHLEKLKGQTLITTDGTTVLGADDKAGIAEIMQACEEIMNEHQPHGRICICFTPDEEIGHGAAYLDLDRLGAACGFTVDGSAPGELSYETFNAASAKVEVNGFNIHPGSAKGKMINANLVAMEINSRLPSDEIPAKTEGREGFYHLMETQATVEKATLSYILRDHSAEKLEARKEALRESVRAANEEYGPGTAELTIHDQYRNMAEIVLQHPEILKRAEQAIRAEGLTPVCEPVRGGTDGAQLTFRGLVCPNLGTGGHAFHGPYEHITTESMETCKNVIKRIILAE
jgi:tripeptide aminopeptidase